MRKENKLYKTRGLDRLQRRFIRNKRLKTKGLSKKVGL